MHRFKMNVTIKKDDLVPALRFKEFDGEWKKFELGKLTLKISVGIATEVRPFVSAKEDVPLLRNQNIKAGYFDDSSMEYIIPQFDESNKSKRVQSGDVIIVRTGSNMGNACVVPERYRGSQTFTTLIVRPISNSLNSEFLSYHINYFGLSEIQRLSAGGGKPNLNAGFLKRYRINVGVKVEQQKIASFLSTVDEKIRQLTRKKELLEEYIKGVMQQLFSGKLRFKNEDGKAFPKWEEKRLGDLCRVARSGGTPQSTKREFYDGEIPFLSISDMTSQGKYLNYTTNQISNLGLENSASWIIPVNTIVYSMYASVGFVAINKIPIATSQAVLNLILKEDVDTEFVYYSLVNFQKKVPRFITTGTQGNLNAQTVKGFIIDVPSLLEQKKIACFLTAIDAKIESVAKQITQTQTFKKGLLRQMFV